VWGNGEKYQLGLGDRRTQSSSPYLVTSIRTISICRVVCGSQHTLALTTFGEVFRCVCVCACVFVCMCLWDRSYLCGMCALCVCGVCIVCAYARACVCVIFLSHVCVCVCVCVCDILSTVCMCVCNLCYE